MGADRKVETVELQKNPFHQMTCNVSMHFGRHLKKNELAGVIFGCTYSTFKECIFKQLFGLPASHIQYVQNITPGMPVFLFNYSDRTLHGLFEAASTGQMYINKYAWTLDGQETTPYPAQVRVNIRMQCHPLLEDQCKPILAENYLKHEPNHLWFELDQVQTDSLISLLSSSPFCPSVSLPITAARWGSLFRQSSAPVVHQEECSSSETNIEIDQEEKERLGALLHQDLASASENGIISSMEDKWSSSFEPQSTLSQNKGCEEFNSEGLSIMLDAEPPTFSEATSVNGAPLTVSENDIIVFPEQKWSSFSQSQLIVCPSKGYGESNSEGFSTMSDAEPPTFTEATSVNGAPLMVPENDIISFPVKKWSSLLKSQSTLLLSKGCEESNSDRVSTMSNAKPHIFSEATFVNGAPLMALENDILSYPERKWSSLLKPQSTLCPSKGCEKSNSEGLSTMSDGKHPIFSGATFVNGQSLMVSRMNKVAEPPTLISEATYLAENTRAEGNSDLRADVNKLTQTMGEIKELQSRQTMKIHSLELELEEARRKLRKSESLSQEFRHSGSSLSSSHLEEVQFEIQDVYQSILLVGGFDGSSWLKNLDCFCPFEEVMRPLVHMDSVRSYSSAVKFDEELYVLGGEYDSSWYDTVESYNLKSHQWTTRPLLHRKKGSLAAVSLLAKIFAIGGGDAKDCFSEVEVLDLNVGKWIVTRSMLQKRFAPAAAELNGVLYVTGGYDGQEYVSSVERFDPRAYSWTRLKSMNSRRACHSLTVLNEKLYAIGGYDGTQMVPTVEVFEPRTGLWTMSEPMRLARGGLGSVNFGEKIYMIGGMQENKDVLDTIECYSEAEGWRLMRSKSMGKRCFSSAVVV